MAEECTAADFLPGLTTPTMARVHWAKRIHCWWNSRCRVRNSDIVPLTGPYVIAELIGELSRPIGRTHLSVELTREIKQVAASIRSARQVDVSRLLPLCHPCSLVVEKKEHFVFADRTAKRSAVLIAIEGSTLGGEVVSSIKVRCPQEFECASVNRIATRLGCDLNLAAAEVAVLAIEVVGEHAQVFDGIEIGNDCSTVVEVLFHCAAIDRESVGCFSLAAHR